MYYILPNNFGTYAHELKRYYASVSNSLFRDLKPENMMYNPTTKILKIIDFGTGVLEMTK